MRALPLADLTATATLVLAGITLGVAVVTLALVLVTRAGTAQARESAQAALDVLQLHLAAGDRPLLVDVLPSAPPPDDMARLDVAQRSSPNEALPRHGPVVATMLPGVQPQYFDPRTVFVKVDGGNVFISVPLRNVGRGLALIDGEGLRISGPGIGQLEYRTAQRAHVPVNETTRIDIVTRYATGEPITAGTAWNLRVPYADLGGTQRTEVHLGLVCRGDDAQGPWLVDHVDHETAGDREAADDHETVGHEEPPEDEFPAPGSSARKAGPRREQVTDLWGNPITKKKRTKRS